MACGDQAASVGDVMDSAKDAAENTMDSAKDAAENTMDAAKDAMSASAPSEEVTATIDAVKSVGGDITALPAEAAVGNINTWITKLSSMEGTEDIVGSLGNLKTELTSGKIDGGKVSGILSELAEQTRELGKGNPALGTIASALDAGAKKLAGK